MSNTMKPRALQLHLLMVAKRRASGAHEPKTGKHLNRARRKEQLRAEVGV